MRVSINHEHEPKWLRSVVVVVVVVVRTCSCTRMSIHTCTRHAMNFKKGQHQCASLFGWTVQPGPPTPVASESRFQASPGAKPHPTPSRGKRLRGSPTSHPTPSEEGAQSFPSPRRWMPWIRIVMRKYTWTCLLGKPDPFPKITIWIRMTYQEYTTSISNPE